MPVACKYRVVVAVAVCAIVLSSLEVDAQQYCTRTAYQALGYTAYRSRSSRYYVKCGLWNSRRCRRFRYHQESFVAYYQHSYSYCCSGYGPLPSCPVKNCGSLSNPANGQVSHTAGTTFGKTATYRCYTCYNLVGSSTRTCRATGAWSGSAPTCQVKNCGTLSNPANGRVSHTGGTTCGQRATYRCYTCYNLVGSSTRTCQSTGRWSGSPPTCQVKDCGTLSNPTNGRVSYTGWTTCGQRATYSCNTGYNHVGSSIRTCQSTGRWSGSPPTCPPKNCGTLSNPTNGRVSHTAGTTYGKTATYSCNTGYRLQGNNSRTCLATGRWSGSPPTCPPKNCSTLSNPTNGRVSHTAGTTFGKTATYSCNTGYNLVGSSTRTCQATGVWSGSAPTCQDVNECTRGTDRCDNNANCNNTPGSYNCSCKIGYTGDGLSCNNINECLNNNGGCNHTCYDVEGSYTCSCSNGYLLNSDEQTCEEVDECAVGSDSCHDNATCHNTQGSYSCSCNTGFTGNGFSCTNVDECLSNNGGCNHNCHDSDGSYTCTCNNGYQLNSDGHTCEDLNECNMGNDSCHNNATCHNTHGSYTCSCNTGYTGNGFLCTNIDECHSVNGGCNHNCHDSDGTYTCSCNNGYQLNSDGHTCEDVDECAIGNASCHDNATCHNSPGNYTCFCNTGYTGNGSVCTNINECLSNNGGCQHNCHDLDGNYTCSCKDDYQLNSDGHTCQGAGNVSFSLSNTPYQNNSLVILEDIGEGDNALLCITSLTACCQPPYTGEIGAVMGNWYFPNGTGVPSAVINATSEVQWDFYRTRGRSVVLLHRRRGGENGIYRCEIPDALGVMQTIYIEVTIGPTIQYHTTTTASAVVQPVATEHAVPLTSTHFNSPLLAGMTGGVGMPIVIAAVLIIVGGVIMKRRRASKRSGNDPMPDAQKEESTNEDVIYEVPTSTTINTGCDTLKKQMGMEMKENVSYENPYQVVKMTECPAYEVPSEIRNMTECPAYEVPSQI